MHPLIKKTIELIKNEDIATLTTRVISEHYDKFIKSPAGCGTHHAYDGGLLDHSVSVAHLANKICEHFDAYSLDKDVTVAGALLHDIGKVKCYKKIKVPDVEFAYGSTELSRYHHHIPIGYHIIASEADKMKISHQDRIVHLLHLILSHHGRLEYHSPVTPQTPEAWICHNADFLDAYTAAPTSKRKTFGK